MNQSEIKQYVENNPKMVSKKPVGDNIFLLKYKASVFYNATWNEFLENCRGTIVDSDFNVVTRTFNKAYNFRVEKNAPDLSDDTPVTAYRKVNGFFCAMTWHNNDVLVSTTGTTDSIFVGYAKEMMLKHMPWEDWKLVLSAPDCQGMTLMFEVCHPSDPHIIPEKTGLYFLGWRENTWDSKVHGFGISNAQSWKDFAETALHCYFPEYMETTVGEIVNLSKTVQHEGFMAWTEDGTCVKIKSPHYLVNKFIARKSPEKLIIVLKNNNYKEMVAEEFYPMCEYLKENLVEFTDMDEQTRLGYIRKYLETH